MVNNKQAVLSPRITEIVNFYFQYPNSSYTQLAKHFSISIQRISQIMSNPRVINAYPMLAKRKVRSLVPRALGKLEMLMDQNQNLNVSEKVVARILDSEKVLQPVEQVIRHEIEFKSVEELQAIIEGAKALPRQVIEGEIVSNDPEAA